MRRFSQLWRTFLCGSLMVTLSSGALTQAEIIESFALRSGSLSPIAAPGRGYVFRSDSGEEEVFDMSGRAFLESKKAVPPGVPGLREIGFKLDNGAEFLFQTVEGIRSELSTMQAAAREHPHNKMVSRLFKGAAGSRLEIALEGPTPVFRTDERIDKEEITLWSNRTTNVPGK